ncbi:hypothetical protein Pse7367_2311 [Thalassoporum mexicanum PCC 7367]|uniref:DUF3318 domain-containing protein n=1 Tax=Thalassoporum mexicanum TaxID=3457544 RepID=UPI00029FABBB|nr:DUF3318 domain-containing protein [Pseudanabaena sp. PCC 7367]AFY70573.1 hypothetical protein Pse7367_2311 [Pseudanabaena sp. PCC 7367]
MNNAAKEILRLRDLLPASWRMRTEVKGGRDQTQVIYSKAIKPWNANTPVYINFGLWFKLPESQRDLLFIREVSWRQTSKWFKLETYQLATLAAVIFTIPEVVQFDPAGMSLGFLFTTVAVKQVLKQTKGSKVQIDADNEAIAVAKIRGYSDTNAARSLLDGIKTVAKLENRGAPEFVELIRYQNLRALGGLSAVGVSGNLE